MLSLLLIDSEHRLVAQLLAPEAHTAYIYIKDSLSSQ